MLGGSDSLGSAKNSWSNPSLDGRIDSVRRDERGTIALSSCE
jgi:hypothetical protein